MNVVLMILCFMLMLLAIFCLHASSEKQIKNTRKRRYQILAVQPLWTKLIAGFLYVLSFFILAYIFDYSIAFLSLWIFSTPLLLIFILLKNDLKQRN
jgi:cell division protein FtsW (lipid II flippase)